MKAHFSGKAKPPIRISEDEESKMVTRNVQWLDYLAHVLGSITARLGTIKGFSAFDAKVDSAFLSAK